MISVLHVDDEPALMDVAKLFLERDSSIQLTTIISVKTAIATLKSTTFDAIISDYEIPEPDGIQFLENNPGERGGSPFIIFTGWTEQLA